MSCVALLPCETGFCDMLHMHVTSVCLILDERAERAESQSFRTNTAVTILKLHIPAPAAPVQHNT